MKWVALGFGVLVLGGFCVLWLGILGIAALESTQSLTTTAKAKAAAPTPNTHAIGDTVVLRRAARDALPVLTHYFALQDSARLGKAGDSLGLQKMIDQGDIVWVADSTQAKVLDIYRMGVIGMLVSDGIGGPKGDGDIVAYEVRLLDGEHLGKKMYVIADYAWKP